jgi:DNA polymerase III epsilon subunit-like protein
VHHNLDDKSRAAGWAHSLLKRPERFVVLDTETTGLLDDPSAEIIQIAVVDGTGRTLLDSYVKPSLSIPAGATRIHGITDDMVASARPFFDVLAEIERAIPAGRRVVIYNADYDRGLLGRHLLTTYGSGVDIANWIGRRSWSCAMNAYAAFVGNWNDYHGNYKWPKLPNLGSDAHTALSDCLATLAVLQEMASWYEISLRNAEEADREPMSLRQAQQARADYVREFDKI